MIAEPRRGTSGSEPETDVAARAFDSRTYHNGGDPRESFYAWLVAPDNPYFVRSFVNRAWAVYFGIGIVDPAEDSSVSSLPTIPSSDEWGFWFDAPAVL